MNEIVIVGAGGFGREVQWLIESINKNLAQESRWNIKGYIDDGIKAGTKINSYIVLGTTDLLLEYEKPIAVVCAIGTSKIRKKVVGKIKKNTKLYFPNLIAPTVEMSGLVEMGKGNIICAGNILTVNIHMNDFCILNLDCTVGHDAVLESFVTVCPSVNVSGCVTLEECVEIGTGTQIIQGKKIGRETIVGAGSAVVKDLPEKCTAVGVPCRVIKGE